MDGPETARRAGLEQGLLLNDFEAQALSLPAIQPDWTRPIGPLAFDAPGPQVILGPGTGLGIAALVEAEGRFTPVSSEACHIDFGPVTDEEYALWPHLERAHGRITSESVLNGRGARPGPSRPDDGARAAPIRISSRRRSPPRRSPTPRARRPTAFGSIGGSWPASPATWR